MNVGQNLSLLANDKGRRRRPPSYSTSKRRPQYFGFYTNRWIIYARMNFSWLKSNSGYPICNLVASSATYPLLIPKSFYENTNTIRYVKDCSSFFLASFAARMNQWSLRVKRNSVARSLQRRRSSQSVGMRRLGVPIGNRLRWFPRISLTRSRTVVLDVLRSDKPATGRWVGVHQAESLLWNTRKWVAPLRRLVYFHTRAKRWLERRRRRRRCTMPASNSETDGEYGRQPPTVKR